MRQTFRQEEAEQILVEAVRRADEQAISAVVNPEVSHEKLLAMADELGVSAETLASVLQEREAVSVQEQGQIALSKARKEFIQYRRAEFFGDLWSYLSTNLMLTGIWYLASPHADFWPKWTLIWWGIFVLWHGMSVVPTGGAEFEKDFVKWQSRRERKAAKRATKEQRRSERDDA